MISVQLNRTERRKLFCLPAVLEVVLGNQLSRPLAVLKGGEAIRYG